MWSSPTWRARSWVASASRTNSPLRRCSGLCLKGDDRARALFDLDKLVFPLEVRSRRPGDLYRPLGAPGRKKLKEMLRARGIPVESRPALPVFMSGGEIIWVPGLPVAEAFKVEKSTASVFCVEITRGSD